MRSRLLRTEKKGNATPHRRKGEWSLGTCLVGSCGPSLLGFTCVFAVKTRTGSSGFWWLCGARWGHSPSYPTWITLAMGWTIDTVKCYNCIPRLPTFFSQIGSFPKFSGWKFQKCLSCHQLEHTWMSRWKLGSMLRINGLFHLLIYGVYWSFAPHLVPKI